MWNATLFYTAILGISSFALPQPVTPARAASLQQVASAVTDCSEASTCSAQCEQKVFASCWKLGNMYLYGTEGVKQDEVRGAALYDIACNGGNASGCNDLGYVHEIGRGVTKDQTRAGALYRKACDAGLPIGCTNLGTMYRDGSGIEKDEARSLELFAIACKGHNGLGCLRLGYMYEMGRAVAKDEARAATLYQEACDAGEAGGCNNLGVLYLDGRGVAKDESRAVPLYKRACDAGNGLGCDNLGDLYLNGRGVPKNEQRAFFFYQKGCDTGNLLSCYDLAGAYFNGRGTAKDEARAVALYQKGCDQNHASSCNNLGVAYASGRGVIKDEARAVAFYSKACEGGLAIGCRNLGGMYRDGLGVANNDPSAFESFVKACDGHDAVGCTEVGYMYGTGRAVAKDEARAAVYYQQGCDGGNALGCSNLGWLYLDGRGVAKNEAHAVELFKRACDAGESYGCNGLGYAYEYARGVSWDEGRAAALYRQACEAGNNTACNNLKRLTQEMPELAQAPAATMPSQGSRSVELVPAEKSAGEKSTAAPPPVIPQKRKDYALLFATNDYDSWQPLKNPLDDAREIAKDLRENYGFETEIVENPTYNQIYDVLRRYAEKEYNPSDQLLIFFAGHGVYDKVLNQGYIVARDSRQDESKNKTMYISHESLRAFIDGMPSKHIFLVMDVCFGGTFDRQIADRATGRGGDEYAFVSLPELIEDKMKLSTRRYLTSGANVYVPDGLPGHHSPFVSHLLEALRSYGGSKGYLTINGIFDALVAVKPSPRHGEWGKNQAGSDFLFISKQAAAKLLDAKH